MDAEDRAMLGAIAESEAGDCKDAGGRAMQGAIVEAWGCSPHIRKHLALIPFSKRTNYSQPLKRTNFV